MLSQGSWCLDWKLKSGYELIKWRRAGMALDFFLFIFWAHRATCGLLVPQPRIVVIPAKGTLPASEAWSLNHRPPRKSQEGHLGP